MKTSKFFLSTLIAASAMTATAYADDATWIGGDGADWNGANWTINGESGSSIEKTDTAIFTVSTDGSTIMNTEEATALNLKVQGGSHTFSGGVFNFTDLHTPVKNGDNDYRTNQNWGTIKIAENTTINIDGGIVISAWSSGNQAKKALAVASGATLSVEGVMQNDSGLALTNDGVIKVGTFSVLTGGGWNTNSISGKGVIIADKLQIGNVTQLRFENNTLVLGKGGITTGGNGFALGNATIGASESWSSTRDITFNAAAGTRTVVNTAMYDTSTYAYSTTKGETITLSGVLTIEGAIEKRGLGTLALKGTTNVGSGGSILVSEGTLELDGAVNLSNAIEVADGSSVSVANSTIFSLVNLNGKTSESGTTFSLISGGTTTFANGMDINNVVSLEGTTVALRAGTLSATFGNGSVTIAGGTAGTLTWNGADGNNTWNYSAENWTGSGATFMNGDNVVFSGSGSSSVTLEAGKTLGVGNMTITSGSYTLSTAAGTASTINGKVLSVASGATLAVGDYDGNSDPGGLRAVRLNFEEIKLSGKISYNNGDTSWGSLEFIGEEESKDGVRHLHIEDACSAGLTIEKTIVTNDAKITANWGGNVCLGDLTLNATLSLGSNNAYSVSNITGTGTLNLGAQLTFLKECSAFASTITGNGNIVVESENLVWTGERNSEGKITIEKGAVLDASSDSARLFDAEHNNGTLDIRGELRVNSYNYGATLGRMGTNNDRVTLDGGTLVFAGSFGAVDQENGQSRPTKVSSAGGTVVVSEEKSIVLTGNSHGDAFETNGGVLIFDVESKGSLTLAGERGKISGTAAVEKSGLGVLTFNTANTYSGGTTISGGQLAVTATGALGDENVEISGGQLSIGSGVEVSNAITIILGDAYNTTDGIAAITGAGSLAAGTAITLERGEEAALTLAAEAPQKYTYQIFDAESSSMVGNEWSFTLGSGWEGWDYSYDNTSGQLTLTIPEPSAFGLLAGVGALALVVSRRRRSRR